MNTFLHNSTPDCITSLGAIRARHRGRAAATQRERLLESLQTPQHCTTFVASRHLDLYDPRARRLELVKAGHKVLTTRRHVVTESGERHSVGVYSVRRG